MKLGFVCRRYLFTISKDNVQVFIIILFKYAVFVEKRYTNTYSITVHFNDKNEMSPNNSQYVDIPVI